MGRSEENFEEKNEEKNPKKQSVFMADSLTINGPRADGNFRVSFDVGVYQYENIKNLPLLNGKMLVVAVVQGQDLKKKGMDNPAAEPEDVGGVQELEDGQEEDNKK